ncbi:MAG: phosphoribosyl-ATP diphosphatase [Saccharofermentans sp.]|nr:phosphoribosyl-ATP diphosphatase [Saccharofermentans sp.]
MSVIHELYSVILDRKANPTEGSYTTYLFSKGTDKISKKVGEEAVETIIAASQRDKQATIQELADLQYHLLVLMADQGITVEDVEAELRSRRS